MIRLLHLSDPHFGTEQPEVMAALLAFAAENLPGYQRPRSVDFVKELPRMPSGKVLRRNIRDAYWQGEKKI